MVAKEFEPLTRDSEAATHAEDADGMPAFSGQSRSIASRLHLSAGVAVGLIALVSVGALLCSQTKQTKISYSKHVGLAAQANLTDSVGLAFVSKGPHTVCRHYSGKEQHENRDAHGQIPVLTTEGLEDCKAQCKQREDCKGIEFRKSENRCEIWTIEIKHSLNVEGWYAAHSGHGAPDFECFVYERDSNSCTTNRELTPRDEAGSCQDRCTHGYKCCEDIKRCVPDESPCSSPPKDCIGTCAHGWNCCIAQGNQCLKHPIPQKEDLCTCK